MSLKITSLLALFCFLLADCSTPHQAGNTANPPAPGFNLAGSDAKAVQIADEVMHAMGGRKNWDNTRYISWSFFGRRKHFWDKWTGNVRIESNPDSTVYLVNINSMEGKVMRRGIVESNPDTLNMLLKRAKSMWINDSYWMVMPFKLKDSGVTLKYMGEENTEAGNPADILQLTFEKVGDTPDNKYLVAVDKKTRLVAQWSYFASSANEKPGFTNPWEDYRKYGNILLSGGRGKRGMTEIAVPENLPEELFTKF